MLAGSSLVSVHAAVQRPTRKNPNTPLSPLPSQRTWKVHWAGEAVKAPRPTRRANDCGH
jgi:hypothetical protein